VVAVIGVQRMVSAPPEAVWEVLADGWVYTGWVVGASRMRAVDPAWPVPDARLHHSVGGWPLLLDDTTSVLEADPGRELVLKARAWPMGAAHVRVLLAAHDGGTLVRMEGGRDLGAGTAGAAPCAPGGDRDTQRGEPAPPRSARGGTLARVGPQRLCSYPARTANPGLTHRTGAGEVCTG